MFKETKKGTTHYFKDGCNPPHKPITKQDKLDLLDEIMSGKLMRLSRKYPQMCIQYLIEMHKAIDWGKKQLKKINS